MLVQLDKLLVKQHLYQRHVVVDIIYQLLMYVLNALLHKLLHAKQLV